MKKATRAVLSAVLAAVMVLGLSAMPLEGLLAGVFAEEPTEYTVLDSCDDSTYYSSYAVDDAEKMQGTSSIRASLNGSGTVQNTKSMAVAVDATTLSKQYLELWFYMDNPNNLTMNNCFLGIYQTSTNKAEVSFNKLGTTLKSGWNKIIVKLSAMTYTNKAQFNTINRVYVTLKTSRTVTLRLDDICLTAAKLAGDVSQLQKTVTAAEALNATDLSGYDAENVETFRAALAMAQSRLENASQRDVDVANTVLNNAMNAFGMEEYTEDAEALVAYIDFNAESYSRMDRYDMRNADNTAGGLSAQPVGGRTAAAFTKALRLAVNDSYVTESDATVRVTYTYYDGEAGTLKLQYNSTEAADKTADSVALANTGAWLRRTVKLTDAALAEAIDGKYDLQFVLDGTGTAFVSRVEIKLVTADDVTESEVPAFAPMTDVNNFDGKSVAGYQMWFTASSGSGGWVHWAGGNRPSNDRISFEMWPDTSEYPASVLEKSGFNNLGDGREAELFTSVRKETVELHVSWMQDAGLDGFAIQRFYGSYLDDNAADNLKLAEAAAVKYNRLFYVMYDLNGAYGSGNQASEVLKSDFVRNVEKTGVIASTSYAQMNGKPVVCMWGLDPNSTSYANYTASMEFICWLQDRGYYVIGGTSNNTWYDGTNAFTEVYKQLDMISPWTVGRYNYNGTADWMRKNVAPALTFCEENGVDYQPVVLAGSAWHNHNWGMPNDQPRNAGAFLWRQAYLLKTQYKCDRLYFAMFDEYDEGTAIMKAAQDSYDIPEDEQYFLTLSADGSWMSSDYYLRLAGTLASIMRDPEATMAATPDIPYSEGPIYWRNSFEKRWTLVREEDSEVLGGRRTVSVTLGAIDVGLPIFSIWESDDSVTIARKTYECKQTVDYVEGNTDYKAYGTNQVGSGLHCDTSKTRTTNGTWSLQFNGTANNATSSKISYAIANTAIQVSAAGLELSYDVYAANDLGRFVYLDLAMSVNGQEKLLSDFASSTKTTQSRTGEWVTVKVTLPASLVGQNIHHVLVGYDHGATGEFNAYIDNVVLQSTGSDRAMLQAAVKTATPLSASSEALKAAVDNATAVLNNTAAIKNDRLKAMKAIDAAIRVSQLTPAGKLGDLDGDEKITTTDARLALQFAANKIDGTGLNMDMANVDTTEGVSTTDARLILQFSAEKITVFPRQG